MWSDRGFEIGVGRAKGSVPPAAEPRRPPRDERAFAHPAQRQQADGVPAIGVHHLSKCYLIYDRPQDRLKQSIVPRLQGLIGKPPQRYYREFWALRDVSFEVRRGETVGIIGRNGAGKSTLLQILCGTLHPNGGSVTTTGRI